MNTLCLSPDLLPAPRPERRWLRLGVWRFALIAVLVLWDIAALMLFDQNRYLLAFWFGVTHFLAPMLGTLVGTGVQFHKTSFISKSPRAPR